jgi:uncharacterized protein
MWAFSPWTSNSWAERTSRDLADYFLDEYTRCADDPAPRALADCYIAYRAVVCAKVDCMRVTQGHQEAAADARRHMDIALEHLRTGAVQLIIVGGDPGTGKTTLSHALAERIGAEVISTDDVRQELVHAGAISGRAGDLNAGLYAPENVAATYDEVLRRAHLLLSGGSSVILDGTWRDSRQRARARGLADQTTAPIVEFTCSVSPEEASARIQGRQASTSDATPVIAAALAAHRTESPPGYPIDTSRVLAESIEEALEVCCRAI